MRDHLVTMLRETSDPVGLLGLMQAGNIAPECEHPRPKFHKLIVPALSEALGRIPPLTPNKVRELSRGGMSQSDIAEALRITPQRVKRILHKK